MKKMLLGCLLFLGGIILFCVELVRHNYSLLGILGACAALGGLVLLLYIFVQPEATTKADTEKDK